MSVWNHCFEIWHSGGSLSWTEGGAEAFCKGISCVSPLLQHARCRVGGALFQEGMDQGCYQALYTSTLEERGSYLHPFSSSSHFVCNPSISVQPPVTQYHLSPLSSDFESFSASGHSGRALPKEDSSAPGWDAIMFRAYTSTKYT